MLKFSTYNTNRKVNETSLGNCIPKLGKYCIYIIYIFLTLSKYKYPQPHQRFIGYNVYQIRLNNMEQVAANININFATFTTTVKDCKCKCQ